MTYENVVIIGQNFSLGKLVITRGALALCEDNQIDYLELAMRHASGDFGSVGHLNDAQLTRAERMHGAFMTDDGLKLNAVAILNEQGMVMSVYPFPSLGDTKIWIQTLLAGPDSKDTYTTILKPDEY